MTITSDTRGREANPVTPPGRAICVNSPPGAPRRVRTRRPFSRPASEFVRFSTPARMGPVAFKRLLLASVGARSGTGGVTTSNIAASAQAEVFPARVRPVVAPYWVNTGFVVGFNPFEDDPFGPVRECARSIAAVQDNNASENSVDMVMTDATEPVVAVIAAASSAGDAISTDPMEI